MSPWLKAWPMLRDWKLIEYIVIGVLCMSIIAALFSPSLEPRSHQVRT
jgi:hypothetical protein